MQSQFVARHARTVILAMAVMLAVISGALLPGHNTASAGGACDAYSGKELYNCLATKLDTVSSYGAARSPETQAALQKAASQLRVATNKAQALSAITHSDSGRTLSLMRPCPGISSE